MSNNTRQWMPNASAIRFRLSEYGPMRTGLAICVAVLIVGCTSYATPVYSVASKNVESVRSGGRSIELLPFAGEQRSVSCRTQPFSPDSGRTFAQYLHDAMRDELVIAGSTASQSPLRLSVTVVSVELDCNSEQPSWKIELEARIDGESPVRIRVVRQFEWALSGLVFFQLAQQSFVPAVQDTIAAILTHPVVTNARRR